MQSKKFRIIAAAAALTVSLVTAPAYALFGVGGIVLDPSNLVQNTSSAIAAVKNEVNTARQYISMLQQVVNSARSVKSIEGLSNLAQVQKELALYNQLANIGSQMSGTLDRSLKLSQSLQAQYGASNMDWKTFITSRDELRKSRAQAMATQYAATDASMKEVAQRRAAIVEQIQAATGETAAMQSVGAGIDALIGQNQQMLGLLNAQGKDVQIQRNEDEAAANNALNAITELQRRRAEAASKAR